MPMDKIKTRNARRAEKWKQNYIKQRNLYREIQKNASDIIQSKNFNRTKFHVQHGDMTVNSHCMNVAKYSLAISDKLAKMGISCKRNELVRGALLHDYFLYDWHKGAFTRDGLHGFSHPVTAERNARNTFPLTVKERGIIINHMWPLTLTRLPRSKEAWLVCWADKYCSLKETLLKKPY